MKPRAAGARRAALVAPDLREFHALEADVALAMVWEDVRPLAGFAGLLDFRLAGRLSELLRAGRVRGSLDEAVLMPARPRLPFEKLVLLGLGPKAEFDDARFRVGVTHLIRTLEGLGARRPVVELPGRAEGLLPLARAIELTVEVEGGAGLLELAWLVDKG